MNENFDVEVITYLKEKFKGIDEKILKNIEEEYINGKVFFSLTEKDLEELGITKRGTQKNQIKKRNENSIIRRN
jgi:hypothetical protein